MDITLRTTGAIERLLIAVSPDLAMIQKLNQQNQSLARKVALVAAAILLFIPSTIIRIAVSPVLLGMWIFQLATPKKPPPPLRPRYEFFSLPRTPTRF